MKAWPKIGSKVTFKGLHMFWFVDMVEAANKLLEFDKEYTIAKLSLNSSWCCVILEEFPEQKFPLSFFFYPKEVTTEEQWENESRTIPMTLEELRDRNK